MATIGGMLIVGFFVSCLICAVLAVSFCDHHGASAGFVILTFLSAGGMMWAINFLIQATNHPIVFGG